MTPRTLRCEAVEGCETSPQRLVTATGHGGGAYTCPAHVDEVRVVGAELYVPRLVWHLAR